MEDLTFERLEKMIFDLCCEMARKITLEFLKNQDEKLMNDRDKNRYRFKDIKKSTIKTLYGDVVFGRRYYKDNTTGKMVFLLDEKLHMDVVGTFSVNVVKMVLEACRSMSFQAASDFITQHTGLNISKTGGWNIVQEIGNNIEEYEKMLADGASQKQSEKKTAKVVFEEADGIWLHQQLPNKKKGKSMELKLCTIYDGWSSDNRQKLVGKKVLGGMCTAKKFKTKINAVMDSIYDIDEIENIIINGDGADWIEQTLDYNAIYQLDRFHVKKAIRTNIKNRTVRKDVNHAFEERNTERLLELIEMYADSLEGIDDKEVKKARALYRYLNRGDAIYSYSERGIKLPDPPEGIVYKTGGVQENQNCTLATGRMKGHRRRWSKNGANNMIKILCSFENDDIDDFIKLPEMEAVGSIDPDEIWSAGSIKKTMGSGNRYLEIYSSAIPVLNNINNMLTVSLRALNNNIAI